MCAGSGVRGTGFRHTALEDVVDIKTLRVFQCVQ